MSTTDAPKKPRETDDVPVPATLRKSLKNRHIQLIALGGAIGTGLFYGSSESIALAGPSILLAYLVGGLAIFAIVRALSEMSVEDPKAGAFSYYATRGISLLDKLDELYKTYGYCLNTLHSYEFDGSAGFARMQSIMQAFRGGIKEFGGKKVVRLLDYVQGLDGLPKSDVLKFLLENNCSLVVRPSGTEPKLKIYISVSAENKEMAEKV